MYDYVQKSMSERVNRRQNKTSSTFPTVKDSKEYKNFPDVRYQRKVVPIQKKAIIQKMKEEDFQNLDNIRTIEIIDRINLEKKKGLAEEVSGYDILKSKIFHEGKQSHISEVTSSVNGKYMQLGWDNCVLFQKGEENQYKLSGVWNMVAGEDAGGKIPAAANIQDNGKTQQPAGQVVNSLVTWGVSSCEVVILVSNDKMHIAAMHINNNMALPFSILKGIDWKTAFISLIDDSDEIQRTQVLLNELNPTNIKILNRGDPKDSGANGHNYIGVNLSEESGPQLFGSQGQCQAGILESSIKRIMACRTWEETKGHLMAYKSLVGYLDAFLLSMTHDRKEELKEENFLKMKSSPEYKDIFENIIRDTIIEQPFLLEL